MATQAQRRAFPWVATFVLAAGAAIPAAAQGSGISFDQGIDAAALRQEIQSAPSGVPTVFAYQSDETATRDCGKFTFRAADVASAQPKTLQSAVYRTVCSGGNVPCQDQLVRIVKRNLAVSLGAQSSILPWISDTLWVCLEGDSLKSGVDAASHKYKFSYVNGPDLTKVVAVQTKTVRLEPDPKGIAVDSLAQDSGQGLVLKLKDRWASFYKGEQTVLTIQVKRDVAYWPDPTSNKITMTFPAQGAYEIHLPLPRAQAGQKFYAEWGFQRKGSVSTDAFEDQGETARVAYSVKP